MKTPAFLHLVVVLFLGTFILMHNMAYAQDDQRVSVELTGQSPGLQEAIQEDGKRILRSPDGEVVGFELAGLEKHTITLRTGRTFEVEPYPETLISRDGQTIVKLGQKNAHAVYLKTDLVFYNAAGQVQKTIIDAHKLSRAAISEDGYVVLGGGLVDRAESEGGFITLYDPSGNRVWSQSLGAGNWATQVSVSPSANTIAVAYSRQEDFASNGRTNLMILRGDGSVSATYEDLHYVQRLLFCGEGSYLAVQAFDRFLLLGASSSEPILDLPKLYRMVGPHGLDVIEDQKLLVVVTAELIEDVDARYRWRLRLLDLENGEELSAIDLPGQHPAAEGKVIRLEDGRGFSVTTETDVFSFQFRSK